MYILIQAFLDQVEIIFLFPPQSLNLHSHKQPTNFPRLGLQRQKVWLHWFSSKQQFSPPGIVVVPVPTFWSYQLCLDTAQQEIFLSRTNRSKNDFVIGCFSADCSRDVTFVVWSEICVESLVAFVNCHIKCCHMCHDNCDLHKTCHFSFMSKHLQHRPIT